MTETNLTETDLTRARFGGAKLAKVCMRDITASRTRWPEGVSVVTASGVGCVGRQTTYRIDTDEVWCGCFKGTLDEFIERVNETYLAGAKYRSCYMAMVRMFKEARKET
jgi:uncharacterized protein YjbI with pentapeptide repeats